MKTRLLAFILASLFALPAIPCDSEQTGLYSAETTWTDASCGVAGIPDDTDAVSVLGTHNVTVDTGSATADSISIGATATLTFATSSQLTVDFDVTCLGNIVQPASGTAELVWGNDLFMTAAGCDPDSTSVDNLNIVHAGGGFINYDTSRGGIFNFNDITLGASGAATTLRDSHGTTAGLDLTAFGQLRLNGGTIDMDRTACADSACTWPPTIEVREMSDGQVAIAGTGTINIGRIEVEHAGGTGHVSVDLAGITFGSAFEIFDFTGSLNSGNVGVLEFDSDADFGPGLFRGEKNGTIDLNGFDVHFGGSFTPGTGTVGTPVGWTVLVDGGHLTVDGACILGSSANTPPHIDLGIGGLVECGSLQPVQAGADLVGGEGARLILTDKTATTAGSDFFFSELRGANLASGVDKDNAVDDFTECLALMIASGIGTDHCYARGGELYDLTAGPFSTALAAGNLGAYGDGPLSDVVVHTGFPQGFETRPTFALAANDTFTFSADSAAEWRFAELRWGTGLHAEIGTLRTACTAPCTLIFNAEPSWRGALTEDQDFLRPLYHWTIDDDIGEFWTRGTLADGATKARRDEGYGPVFAHMFDTPGSFTLTMRMHDGTTFADATSVTIEIADPADVFPGTATVCIANGTTPIAGSDGCPLGAGVRNVSGAGAFDDLLNVAGGTPSQACNSDGIRCLLKTGDTFDGDGLADMDCVGCQLGFYGTDLPPVAECFGLDECLRLCDGSNVLTNGAIYGIKFQGDDSPDSKGIFLSNGNLNCTGDKISIVDVELEDFSDSINMTHFAGFNEFLPLTTCAPATTVNNEIAIVDSLIHGGGNTLEECATGNGNAGTICTEDTDCTDGTTTANCVADPQPGGNDLFFSGHNLSLLGNSIGDKDSGICRTGNVDEGEACSSNTTCDDGGGEGTGECDMEEHNIRQKLSVCSVYAHNDLGLMTDDGRAGCGEGRAVHLVRAGFSSGLHTDGVDHDLEWTAHPRYSLYQDQFIGVCLNNEGWGLDLTPTDASKIAYASHTNLIETYLIDFSLNLNHGGQAKGISIAHGLHNVVRNIACDLVRDDGMDDGSTECVHLWDELKVCVGGADDGDTCALDANCDGVGTCESNGLNYSAGNEIYNVSAESSTGTGSGSSLVTIDHAPIYTTKIRNSLLFDATDSSLVHLLTDLGTDTDAPLDGGLEVTTTPWSTLPSVGLAIEDFKLITAQEGTNLGLLNLMDAEHRCRWEDALSIWDLGAHQTDATPCLSTALSVPSPSMQGGSISGGGISMREQIELMFQIVGVPYAR